MRPLLSILLLAALLIPAAPARARAFAGPVAASFSTAVPVTVQSVIQLQGSDADGTPLTYATTSGPSHGALSNLNTATGAVVYTPTSGYTGSDSFTYTVTSGGDTSSAGTVTITVTAAKTRIIDTFTNPDGTPRSGKVTFILTKASSSPSGLIPVGSSVTCALNGAGQCDVSLYPSHAVSPVQFYQVQFNDSNGNSQLFGLYDIPASTTTITLAGRRITDTNLQNQFVFASKAEVDALTAAVATATIGAQLLGSSPTGNALQKYDSGTGKLANSGVTDDGTTVTSGRNTNVTGNLGVSGNATVGGNASVTGTVTAAGYSGIQAANVPSLDASKITTGTLSNSRTTATNSNTPVSIVARDANGDFSARILSVTGVTASGAVTGATVSGNGSALTNLSGSNIASGTVADARLPSAMTGKTISSSTINSSTVNSATINTPAVSNPTLTGDVTLDTSSGSRLGTATSQKLGFYGSSPVVQPSGIKQTSGATLSQIETDLNLMKQLMVTLGLMGDPLLAHILVTGQSNATGASASPALSTSQPYANKMFVTGVCAGGSGLTSLIPLVENASNCEGETIASGMANKLTSLTAKRYLVSNHGVSGARYSALKKGTTPYANGIAQVTAANSIVPASGQNYRVGAVAALEGETDQQFDNASYTANLAEWQSDYETDIKAITGQTGTIPLLVDQQNGYAPSGAGVQPNSGTNSVGTSTAYQTLRAYEANPTKVVLVGPNYQYPYADTLHKSNHAQRWSAEKFSQVYKKTAVDGQTWAPLYPTSCTLSTATITCNFNVPSPPLVLDYAMVFNPGKSGFEYFDDSGAPPAITSVVLTNATTGVVTITLASTPTGGNKQLRYAHTGGQAGNISGARGNLRDSDPSVSPNGYPLYNWCIQFVKFL